MKLKDAIRQEKGEYQYPERWTKPVVTIETEQIDTGIPCGFGVLNDYTTKLEIVVKNRCNDVQWRHDVQEIAVKQLFGTLFGETRAHIQRAMSAVYGEDKDELLACLADALETMEAS